MHHTNIVKHIENTYPQLTRKQQGIADYLSQNPEAICYMTLAQLSALTQVSQLTFLRFCEKLGFSNFMELKTAFRTYTCEMIQQVTKPSYLVPDECTAAEPNKEQILQQIARAEAQAMAQFTSQLDYAAIIETSHMIAKSQCTYLFVHDISKVLASYLAARLHLLGMQTKLIDLDDFTEIQESLRVMTTDDVVIFFSFPKYYYPAKNIAQTIQTKGVPIITITDSAQAPVAPYSTIVFPCETSTRMFYNTHSQPMALLNLLSSCAVMDVVSIAELADFKQTISS